MLYLRRLVWFIASRLILICILLGMLVCAFYMCLNTANIYVILTDGLEQRTQVILTQQDAEKLNYYFHADFLSTDPALEGAFDGSSVYDDYMITTVAVGSKCYLVLASEQVSSHSSYTTERSACCIKNIPAALYCFSLGHICCHTCFLLRFRIRPIELFGRILHDSATQHCLLYTLQTDLSRVFALKFEIYPVFFAFRSVSLCFSLFLAFRFIF